MLMLNYIMYGLNLNDPISPLFEKLDYFHDLSINMLIVISLFILFSIYKSLYSKSFSMNFIDNKVLEIWWTVVPALILMLIAFPSLSLLYFMDTPLFQLFNNFKGKLIKVIGHQWYWSYEYKLDKFESIEYDSFLLPYSDLSMGSYRLLEVDKPLVIKYLSGNIIQGLSDDVMHSWTCPSMGIKFDVVPGRLNSSSLIATQLGVFYGQCSEICGANHSFMPIQIEVMK